MWCIIIKCPKIKMERDSGGAKETRVVLPWELIIEILLKLPVKSLVRFKCVCKSWFSLISDSHFAISQYELADPGIKRLLLLDPTATEIRSIDTNASLYDDSAVAELKLNFVPPEHFYFRILGSCRGFLLLDYNGIRRFCIWNPSTGVHKFVNRSSIADMGYMLSTTFLSGFVYDPSSDDYLVVQTFYPYEGERIPRVVYFSLRANAWEEIEATHLPYRRCSNYDIEYQTGLFLNGAIHWLAFRYDVSIYAIVAFDSAERGFSEISLPVDFVYESFQICLLRVLGELLNLCAVRYNHSVEIWAMKKYKVQSSWTNTIVVSVDDFPTQYFFPICSTKSGDIVGRDYGLALVKCNDKGQLQEDQDYCNDQYVSRIRMALYTESLLSLPYNSEQAEEEQAEEEQAEEDG